MKKIASLLLTVCAVALFSVSCTEKDKQHSFSLSSASLAFEASVTEPQTITVIAENVGWSSEVASSASGWLEAKQDGNILTVSVKDNTRAEGRTGTIKVTPDSSDVSPKEIIVTQKGSSDPVTPEIILTPSSLAFEGDKAEAQEVTVVMRGDGFTWTATAETAATDWLKIESKEGKIVVTVADNPLVKERSGKISVVPSEKGIAPKSVMVTQKGKNEPPALSVDVTDGLLFGSRDTKSQSINVNAVNCDWGVAARDASEVGVSWITPSKKNNDRESSVGVTVAINESEERVAYVVLTALGKDDGEPISGIPVVKVKVTQSKGSVAVSTLEEDIVFTATDYLVSLLAAQRWDTTTDKSLWDLNFYDSGITFQDNGSAWPPKQSAFIGTGHRVCIELTSTVIRINDERAYFIPNAQDYTVNFKTNYYQPNIPYTINSGVEKYSYTQDPVPMALNPLGSWYYTIKDDKEIAQAPIVDGTIHIERDGFNYVITMNLLDDAGHKIDVKFNGSLDKIKQGNSDLEPPGTPDPDEPTLPDFPNPEGR